MSIPRKEWRKCMNNISLLEEDINLLIKLHDFTFLDSNTIARYVLKRRLNNTHRRLATLREAGYIQSFDGFLELVRRPIQIFTLTRLGSQVVEEFQGYSDFVNIRKLPVTYTHTIEVAKTVLAFEETGEKLGMIVKEFIPEKRAFFQYGSSKKHVLRPDGVMIIGHKDNSDLDMGIFIELEKTRNKRSVMKEKMLRYGEFFGTESIKDRYLNHLSLVSETRDWLLLFVATNEPLETYTKNLLLRQKPIDNKLTDDRAGFNFPTLLTTLERVQNDAFEEIYLPMEQDELVRCTLDEHL